MAASMAAASDGQRYPANNCVVYTGTASYANGTIINNASVPLGVECPVLTEWKDPDNTQILGLRDISVRVIDNNPSANIKCEFFTADVSEAMPNLLENTSFQTRYSSGASGLPQNLQFGSAPADRGDFSIMRCVLPPKSGNLGSALISYTVAADYTLS
jgi:hypothetical protein